MASIPAYLFTMLLPPFRSLITMTFSTPTGHSAQNPQCIMKERPAKRRRAPPPLRYAVQGFAPLRRRLGVTAMANRV